MIRFQAVGPEVCDRNESFESPDMSFLGNFSTAVEPGANEIELPDKCFQTLLSFFLADKLI